MRVDNMCGVCEFVSSLGAGHGKFDFGSGIERALDQGSISDTRSRKLLSTSTRLRLFDRAFTK
jgi:hypothetical protein